MNNETNIRPTTAAEYQYARKDIVERLEKEISHGDVLNLIERCDDMRRTLLHRTEDGSLFDRELEEYKDFYTYLDVMQEVRSFLNWINQYGPDSQYCEARKLLVEKFGEGAESWLK